MTLKQLIRPRWRIGILETPLEGVIAGEKLHFVWAKNPFPDRWFADPFVLSVAEDELVLLVEDYRFDDPKGRISKIVVDRRRGAIVSCKTVIEGDGHYSSPAILRKDGKVYVYPEQSRQGRLDLFEYCQETETCKFIEMLSEEPLTDAIIYKGVIFSTRQPDPNGKELYAYELNRSLAVQDPKEIELTLNSEPVTLNRPKTFVFDECVARNAGDFFEVDGVTYRPAQECNRWYGNAVSIQRFEEGKFTEVRRIPGIHTLNSYQGVTVVDKKVFPFKWLYRLLNHSDL